MGLAESSTIATHLEECTITTPRKGSATSATMLSSSTETSPRTETELRKYWRHVPRSRSSFFEFSSPDLVSSLVLDTPTQEERPSSTTASSSSFTEDATSPTISDETLGHSDEETGSHHPLFGAVFIVLHGNLGTVSHIRYFTSKGFEALADRHEFLVVYPENESSWEDWDLDSTPSHDVEYIRGIIIGERERSSAQFFDSRRSPQSIPVFVVGFDSGGCLAMRVARDHGDLVSGIGCVGCLVKTGDELKPWQSAAAFWPRPVPACLIFGESDTVWPMAGGQIGSLKKLEMRSPLDRFLYRQHSDSRGTCLSLSASMSFLCRNNGVFDTQPVETELPRATGDGDGTSVTLTRYVPRSSDERPVWLYFIRQGSHWWPSGPQFLPAQIFGAAPSSLDANDALFRFFCHVISPEVDLGPPIEPNTEH